MIKRHSPPHIYADETIYFITSRCFNKQNILNTPKKRTELLNKINKELKGHRYKLFAYAILLNHYHLVMGSNRGEDMQKIFRYIHGALSAKWNKEDRTPGRKIWNNYFDKTIKNEADFYRHLNYIHHNSIKHQLARTIAEWEWSSYRQYKKKYGIQWLADSFVRYPIINFSTGDKDVI